MVLDEHILSSGWFSLGFYSQSGLVFDSQPPRWGRFNFHFASVQSRLCEAAVVSDTNANNTTLRRTMGPVMSVTWDPHKPATFLTQRRWDLRWISNSITCEAEWYRTLEVCCYDVCQHSWKASRPIKMLPISICLFSFFVLFCFYLLICLPVSCFVFFFSLFFHYLHIREKNYCLVRTNSWIIPWYWSSVVKS